MVTFITYRVGQIKQEYREMIGRGYNLICCPKYLTDKVIDELKTKKSVVTLTVPLEDMIENMPQNLGHLKRSVISDLINNCDALFYFFLDIHYIKDK